MNVVDSSGWLEYFAAGHNTLFFTPIIEQPKQLIVPVITVYEVFKPVLQQTDEHNALQAVAVMLQGRIVEVDSIITLDAARLSIRHKLPMADSLILATALLHNATLWTEDAHFAQIAGVQYKAKAKHP